MADYDAGGGDTNLAWIAGFFDGEGYIGLKPGIAESYTIGYKATISVKIDHTTKRPLDIIQENLDNNGIGSSIRDRKMGGENHQDQYRWKIQDKQGVKCFLSTIRPYSVDKIEQIEIMAGEIIPFLQEKGHTTKVGFLELMEMKERLDSTKQGVRGKYTLEYFEEEWDMELDNQRGISDF